MSKRGGTPAELPVFRLVGPERAPDLGSLWEGIARTPRPPLTPDDRADVEWGEDGQRVLVHHRRSGGIWFADREVLGSVRDVPPEDVLADGEAAERGRELLESVRLWPAGPPPSGPRVETVEEVRGTIVARRRLGERSSAPRRVDTQLILRSEVHVPGVGTDSERVFPVIGGGRKTKVAFGPRGRVGQVVAFGRPLGDMKFREVIPRREAVRRFLAERTRTPGTRVRRAGSERGCRATLAYYEAPVTRVGDWLAPVWVLSTISKARGSVVESQRVVVPAVEDVDLAGATGEGRPPEPETLVVGEPAVGTWAIPVGGQGCSEAKVAAFAGSLDRGGWCWPHRHEHPDVLLEHWVGPGAPVVEAVDLAYYSGHANWQGWKLSGRGYAFHSALVPLGTGRLRWMVVSGCGPLEDSRIIEESIPASGEGDVFTRWSPLFGGLRMLLAYGSTSYCERAEGAILAFLARAGWSILQSWFLTALLLQPTQDERRGLPVYAAAMYPFRDGEPEPASDLLPRALPIAPLAPPHDGYVAIWSPT